jgi:hypothetical protein
MIKKLLYIPLFLSASILFSCSKPNPPLSLHPDNPHYFLFRGEAVVLIGSTEHYGAVLNLDFDYIKYLDELGLDGLNVTRTFTGFYLEPKGAFRIAENTMAPGEGKLICPWARSSEPGYAGGGNKFDLNRWDDAYFARLKDFVSEAGKRNIIVELDLFSNIYDTIQWKLSPLHVSNNINEIENIPDHKEILSLRHPGILEIQEKMVRKIIAELKGFDNLYYEVCNEPYFGDLEALESWEQHMTSVIADAEKDFSLKHLISQNIANGSQKIENPNPLVSIFNFHYAKTPVTVEMNYSLNKVIGDNETGFSGIEDATYRTEAWGFMVAGGGLFNHLDYSFTVEHEDGTFKIAPGQPGGGGKTFRGQMNILKTVFEELDFIAMKPSNHLIKGTGDTKASVRLLAEEGKQYLLYANNSGSDDMNYSLRYSGFLNVPVSGGYWISTMSDNGVRLRIGDKLLISNWTTHGTVKDSAYIELTSGKNYPLKLEYFQGLGGAQLQLNWTTPANITETIPISALKANDERTPGLSAEKFSDIELKTRTDEFIVSQIDAVGIKTTDTRKEESFILSLELPEGNYTVEWINPVNGERTKSEIIGHPGGLVELSVPLFLDDVALKIEAF